MRKGGLTLEGYSEETVRLVGYGRRDYSRSAFLGARGQGFYIIHYDPGRRISGVRRKTVSDYGGGELPFVPIIRSFLLSGPGGSLGVYVGGFYGEGDRAAIVTYRILFLLAGCSCDWCRGYSSFV